MVETCIKFQNVKFFLDENVPPLAATKMRDLGYECIHIQDLGMKGVDDEVVLEKAIELGACLCTCNGKDFVIQVEPLCASHDVKHDGLYWVKGSKGWRRTANNDICEAIHVNTSVFISNHQSIINHIFHVAENSKSEYNCWKVFPA